MKFVINKYKVNPRIKPIDEAYFEEGEWCVDIDSLDHLLCLMEKYNDQFVTITDSRPNHLRIDIFDWNNNND